MDILLVRHGESEGNVLGRLQGHGDSPLTALGRAQARRLGGWLRVHGPRWSAAYAAPLAGARETAQLIAERSGFPVPTIEEDLREVCAGSLEGLTRDEIFKRHPHYIQRGITDLGDFGEFGGEAYDDVQARVRRVLARLEDRHRPGADVVLVVAHGGVHFPIVETAGGGSPSRGFLFFCGDLNGGLARLPGRRRAFTAEGAGGRSD